MKISQSPSLESASELVKDSLQENSTILLVGTCVIDYEGRANSFLPEGERIVIIKPDGTLLVHQKAKRKPVNWNPPGCKARVEMEEEELRIISSRSEPKETICIFFKELKIVASFELEDEAELQLVGTEEDLVRSIVQNPDLIESGFTPKEKNKKIKTGEVDLYGEDSEGRGVIIEFKRGKATSSAVWQLGRYVNELEKKLEKEIRGIVAAPEITSGGNKLLGEQDLEFIKIEELPTRKFKDVVYDKNQKQIKEFDSQTKN